MNNLKESKVLFLGDSITEGSGATNMYGFAFMFKDMTGAYTHIDAIGGTRYARKKVPSLVTRYDYDFCARLERLPKLDFDYVCVFGGTNDWGHGDAKLGNKNDTTSDTFYGATNYLYSNIKEMYPNSKIIIMTPLHRADEDEKNHALDSLETVVRVEKEMADKYGFYIYDLYSDESLNATNKDICLELFADGLHPNDKGHKLLASKVIDYLSNL